jgi:TfoX/Sxy family transcriptional regulator of competence genes
MVASDSFAEFLHELLAPLGRVTIRRMFGKTGVFCEGLMLGMVTDNTLYFRVDDRNRGPSKEPSPRRLSATRRRALQSNSRFGARRKGCSRNPTSFSRGRKQRWRRRVGSPRKENRRREDENQSLTQREVKCTGD